MLTFKPVKFNSDVLYDFQQAIVSNQRLVMAVSVVENCETVEQLADALGFRIWTRHRESAYRLLCKVLESLYVNGEIFTKHHAAEWDISLKRAMERRLYVHTRLWRESQAPNYFSKRLTMFHPLEPEREQILEAVDAFMRQEITLAQLEDAYCDSVYNMHIPAKVSSDQYFIVAGTKSGGGFTQAGAHYLLSILEP